MTVKAKTSKRWKKGQSSSSNPSANKHREAAKSRFFQVPGIDSDGANRSRGERFEQVVGKDVLIIISSYLPVIFNFSKTFLPVTHIIQMKSMHSSVGFVVLMVRAANLRGVRPGRGVDRLQGQESTGG
jgi:hypothetical protein